MNTSTAPLATLAPHALWQWFARICAIPHPSKHEEALRASILEWAHGRGLEAQCDAVGNLILRKPATPGMEQCRPVALQAHLDMVPQKNAATAHDFLRDPILPRIEDGWVKATGTTLGADNGIGMASALAVLEADDLLHGPLEVLLTVDEEAGMTGAFGLQPGTLQAELLINTDSEQEGEIYMGCAGGVDASFTLPLTWQAAPAGHVALQLTLDGLQGGHSGVNIHLGRGNANKLLLRFLADHSCGLDWRLAQLEGGSLRNAIPREARCLLLVPAQQATALHNAVSAYASLLTQEYGRSEPGLRFAAQPAETTQRVLDEACQRTLVALLHACPNGVQRMSDAFEGVPETSLNLGVIRMHDTHLEAVCLVRSLIDSGRIEVEGRLRALADLAGATLACTGAYPGWAPDPDSALMGLVQQTYRELFASEPAIMVIHAGLECGLFKASHPDMDMVSIGPTIRFPHGPDEMVHIASVGAYWTLLTALLARIPARA